MGCTSLVAAFCKAARVACEPFHDLSPLKRGLRALGRGRFKGARDHRRNFVMLVAAVLGIITASSCERARSRPPLPTSTGKMNRPRVFADPALQRLADSGAWINPQSVSKWIGPGTSVEFRAQEVRSEDLEGVSEIGSPVFLSFEKCDFRTGALRPLNQIQNIKYLSLDAAAAPRDVFSDLSALPKLQAFFLQTHDGTAKQSLDFIATTGELRDISLNGPAIRDGALVACANMRCLVRLNLNGASITDEGLSSLSHLRSLMQLYLANCSISDSGLHHLASLEELRTLDLSLTRVTDFGLPQLARLRELESLSLQDTEVSGAGLAALRSMPNLESIDLSGTRVTDDLLKQISVLKQLRMLFIRNSQITNAGLRYLKGLPNLQYLDAVGTRVTASARRTLPKVRIVLASGGGT